MYPSLTAEINASRGSVLGIMDFRYAPYALGDACTWLTKLQIMASRHSLSNIEIVLITLPYAPSSGLQRHITPYNYAQVMDGLMPAFLCCRNLRSVQIFEHNGKALHRLLGVRASIAPSSRCDALPLCSKICTDLRFLQHRNAGIKSSIT